MKSFKVISQILVILVFIISVYWAGYSSGLKAKQPNLWALAIVRRNPLDNSPAGEGYLWFDFNNPVEVARFHAEEGLLKVKGVEYRIAQGVVESSIYPNPDPQRVSAHR